MNNLLTNLEKERSKLNDLSNTTEVQELRDKVKAMLPEYAFLLEEVVYDAPYIICKIFVCKSIPEKDNGYIQNTPYYYEGNPWIKAYNSLIEFINERP